MKSKNIVIFGSGGHAGVVISEIIKTKKFKIIGFVDDYFRKSSKNLLRYYKIKYLGNLKNFSKSKIKKNIFGFAAIGENKKREETVKRITKVIKKIKWAKLFLKMLLYLLTLKSVRAQL